MVPWIYAVWKNFSSHKIQVNKRDPNTALSAHDTDEPRSKNSAGYFPSNPGCLIGILKMVYEKISIPTYNCIVFNLLYTMNN